jgi:anti-sigma factor RsiW
MGDGHTTHDQLTCQELAELITTYIEGGMDEGERERVAAHLAACAGCRAYLGQMRWTIRLSAGLGERALADGDRGALIALFRRAWGDGETLGCATPSASGRT